MPAASAFGNVNVKVKVRVNVKVRVKVKVIVNVNVKKSSHLGELFLCYFFFFFDFFSCISLIIATAEAKSIVSGSMPVLGRR